MTHGQGGNKASGGGGERPPRSRSRRRGQRRGGSIKSREERAPDVSPELRERLAKTLDDGEYIVFDIETTGGNPEKNGITEIFAVRYQGGEARDTFYSLVNPEIPIPPIVRRMTGIDNKMERNAPKIDAVMPDFVKFAGSCVLVSHNTIGDMKFLRYFAQHAAQTSMDNFFLCTHLLVEKLVHEAPDKSLKGLAEFFDLKREDFHRAEGDAYVTLELFKVLLGKLKARKVRTIDEAVRLQGDLESGLRLGWGVPPESLVDLPPGPGVFYLYDHEKKLLFLSSAMQLDREVEKLKIHSQLPRQLLKLTFRTYEVRVRASASPFQAMLDECDAVLTDKPAFEPVNWHQRAVQTLGLAREKDGIRLDIGPVVPGTVYAFGPVRDRRIAGEFLEALGAAFGHKAGRHGLLLPATLETDVLAVFQGQLAAERATLDKRRKSLALWFKPSERKVVKDRLALLDKLGALKPPQRMASLLDRSGVIVVETPGDLGGATIHEIVRGRPRGVTTVREGWEDKLRQGLAKELAQRIESAAKAPDANAPVTEAEAGHINAALWWILSGGKDARFIALSELR
jgi:DNA polymerase III epsilon subunit family exonuclease